MEKVVFKPVLNVLFLVLLIFFTTSCEDIKFTDNKSVNVFLSNVLNYTADPKEAYDREALVFSDQGAWFGYGFPTEYENLGGFSGPFLMTQENGRWLSNSISSLTIIDKENMKDILWDASSLEKNSYPSYLEQKIESDKLTMKQKLFFSSPYTAIIIIDIENKRKSNLSLLPAIEGCIHGDGFEISLDEFGINITSNKSDAVGYIQISQQDNSNFYSDSSGYKLDLESFELHPGESYQIKVSHSFIFPEYNIQAELAKNEKNFTYVDSLLNHRIKEKEEQLKDVIGKENGLLVDNEFQFLATKCLLTLQNNWRGPAGELKHSGLFPSYHYRWFHGMWAWDSWKHAVALAMYDPQLAKDQIRVMFDFMDEDGFIADCIYRDTTIENHNYRNTKPPLSAWAVWEVFLSNHDTTFLLEMYPKLLLQHQWWYQYRDYDKDSICEYGSTDGTLVAAKWESGMDNAVRFDNSKLLKSSDNAYSLNQESVDLNSYLYAEKLILSDISSILGKKDKSKVIIAEAGSLRSKIQNQFYDSISGWFYDTSIDGDEFIDVMGCEGWIPLWAEAATTEQSEGVMENIMDSTKFNTYVPLQTLSADHPKFKPQGGYWRGPTWLDQAYFGVIGLDNYGYSTKANFLTRKLIYNAEGVMEYGKAIRENYNPINGKGLESHNFSWSAAHYLLLVTK